MRERISLEKLKRTLSYDPETGVFKWLVSHKYNIPAGSEAGGWTDKGYRFIKINSRAYLSHRLAIFYMTGRWPVLDLDHINGIRYDNRFANLREVMRSEGHLNRKKYVTNTSGIKGVHWHVGSQRWRVRIGKHGRRHSLGCFKTLEEASIAYGKAADEMFGEFRRMHVDEVCSEKPVQPRK